MTEPELQQEEPSASSHSSDDGSSPAQPSFSPSSWLPWGRGKAMVPTLLFLLVLGGYVGLVLLPWLGLLLGHNPLLW